MVTTQYRPSPELGSALPVTLMIPEDRCSTMLPSCDSIPPMTHRSHCAASLPTSSDADTASSSPASASSTILASSAFRSLCSNLPRCVMPSSSFSSTCFCSCTVLREASSASTMPMLATLQASSRAFRQKDDEKAASRVPRSRRSSMRSDWSLATLYSRSSIFLVKRSLFCASRCFASAVFLASTAVLTTRLMRFQASSLITTTRVPLLAAVCTAGCSRRGLGVSTGTAATSSISRSTALSFSPASRSSPTTAPPAPPPFCFLSAESTGSPSVKGCRRECLVTRACTGWGDRANLASYGKVCADSFLAPLVRGRVC
mmetsp:Transcript_37754/g.94667  ORF Transcript_37754/g.94667 Transcript_37754/m.94667 type:complete len:316 (+) Transcript_37754:936-1883(+)